MSLAAFAQKWCWQDQPPKQVSADALEAVERQLDFAFPPDYKRAVLDNGLPHISIGLLNSIVDQDLERNALSDFYIPVDILRLTDQWRHSGMPSHFVVFACDFSGYPFCFDVRKPGSSIWFYDKDFAEAERIAPDFDAWLRTYCAIEPSLPDG